MAVALLANFPVAASECGLEVRTIDAADSKPLPAVRVLLVDPSTDVTIEERRGGLHGVATFFGLVSGNDHLLRALFEGAVPRSALVRCAGERSSPSLALEFPQHVSLVRLLATPMAFHGKFVRVEGFLRLRFEGNALFLTAEDRRLGLGKNAVWVDATNEMYERRKELTRGPVSIVARFDAEDLGHMNLFGGALEDVQECTTW